MSLIARRSPLSCTTSFTGVAFFDAVSPRLSMRTLSAVFGLNSAG
jgi:hypothetical protein